MEKMIKKNNISGRSGVPAQGAVGSQPTERWLFKDYSEHLYFQKFLMSEKYTHSRKKKNSAPFAQKFINSEQSVRGHLEHASDLHVIGIIA